METDSDWVIMLKGMHFCGRNYVPNNLKLLLPEGLEIGFSSYLIWTFIVSK